MGGEKPVIFLSRQISRQFLYFGGRVAMSKKGENIYKRKDGRWEGRYIKARNEQGRIIYGYIYGKKYSIVKKRLAEFQVRYAKPQEGISLYSGTLAEWLSYWLNIFMRQRIKVSTYLSYQARIDMYIIPFLGNKKLIYLKKADVEKFLFYLSTLELSSSTVRSIFMVLKGAMNRAFSENYILSDPCKDLVLKSEDKRTIRALSRANQHKLEMVSLEEKGCSAVILALYTGMRIGEISALRWEDVDFEKNIILVKKTLYRVPPEKKGEKTRLIFGEPKTKASKRTIPIADNLKEYLLKKKEESVSDYVISCKNSFAEPRVISYRFKKVLSKANVDKIQFHALRHTFATRCVEQGIDIATLSKLLGHSSIKLTLDTYTDSMWESRKNAIYVIDGLLGKPPMISV